MSLGHSKTNGHKGYTLLELVVVIAVMAALIGVITPMFVKYIEKSKQSVDVTNAEAAYSAAMVEFSDKAGSVSRTLYFDGQDVTDDPSDIKGYGKSAWRFEKFVPDDFPVADATGIPFEGWANYIIITMDSSGVRSMRWGIAPPGAGGGGPIPVGDESKGFKNRIFTPAQWTATTDKQKVDRDEELFDALEVAAAEMTYGDLLNRAKDEHLVEMTESGHLCIRIASSSIRESEHTIIEGNNEIYMEDLFRNAGYNTELPNDERYIVTSRTGGEADVWIDLGYSKEEIEGSEELRNKKATDAIVYVEGGDTSHDEGALAHDRRAARKKGGRE